MIIYYNLKASLSHISYALYTKNSPLKNIYHYSIKIFIIIFSSENQIADTTVLDNGPHGPVGIDHRVN